MDLSQLHFAHPLWLWTLIVIPLIAGLFLFYYQAQQPHHQLEKFIDKHLLPFLLQNDIQKKKRVWITLAAWSIVWSCLALALAGPRWEFHEMATFSRDQSLTILLDLSESMNVQDVTPSRLGRAKQKIEDLLNMSKGVKIGLIAFAADPHMIVPMTDDKETIRHLLPSLNTDLVYVQGSKLAPALEMAANMLANEPGNNKAIVIISDGGFGDPSALHTAKKLSEKGVILYTLGVGTLDGAPLKDRHGAMVKKNGSPILSKLEKEKFSEISKIGQGRYFDADHSEQIALLFEDLQKRSDVQQESHKTQRFWKEHFYLFLLPVLPFFLWWYRRGYLFALFLFIITPINTEASLSSYFYNQEQQAQHFYESENYTTASQNFQDPYRKGVAYYRMEDYKTAEEMFRQSTRPEVACSATYNLGNALAQQNKLREAITAYEDVLKKWPDHKEAKENLDLVKKMLEEQDQQQEQQDQQQEQKDKNQQEKKEDPSQKDNKEKPPEEPSQNEPNSDEKESDSNQKPENNDSENEDSQNGDEKEPENSSEDKEQLSEEKEEPKDAELAPAQEDKEKQAPRSQEDLDADLWLNQIKNDPKSFLKNKFYIESKKNGTKEEVDPW